VEKSRLIRRPNLESERPVTESKSPLTLSTPPPGRAPFGRCTYRSMITSKLSRGYLFSQQRFRRHEGKCNSSFRPWHASVLHWTCLRLPRISSKYLSQRKISDLPSISRSLRAVFVSSEKQAARSPVAECRPILVGRATGSRRHSSGANHRSPRRSP
jgi:hypothetical protein